MPQFCRFAGKTPSGARWSSSFLKSRRAVADRWPEICPILKTYPPGDFGALAIHVGASIYTYRAGSTASLRESAGVGTSYLFTQESEE